MNRRWICTDVWMDILPSFDRPKLGLQMALLSFRFDVLVDKHFDDKTTELTIWRPISILKDERPKPIVSVRVDGKWVDFPFPDCPLRDKIRFKKLLIEYIDHSVITFLHSNKQIWDRSGTKLELDVWSSSKTDNQAIWDAFARQIWPIFATNIRHLGFTDCGHLDNLRRLISPTILTDLDQLNSITSDDQFLDVIADFDGPNANSGKALSKWLHTPSTDGQPKRLRCRNYSPNLKWVNNYKEIFLRATASVSYKIRFGFWMTTTAIEPFELVNERTKEKLTLSKESSYNNWLLKRCPIVSETAAVQQQKKDANSDDDWEHENLDHLNGINFILHGNCIGPLSPPEQSDEKVFSFPGPSDQSD